MGDKFPQTACERFPVEAPSMVHIQGIEPFTEEGGHAPFRYDTLLARINSGEQTLRNVSFWDVTPLGSRMWKVWRKERVRKPPNKGCLVEFARLVFDMPSNH